MFSYLCVGMPALVSCSDFGEHDTVVVIAAGQGFFSGWVVGRDERKSEDSWSTAIVVPRGVFDYRTSKRLTFTDVFHSVRFLFPIHKGLKVSWMHFAAEIKRLFWCLTVILIEGRGSH